MSGILLIATFVFLFFFGYRMTGILDRFLGTSHFHPEDENYDSIIQNEDLAGQELAHRAS